MSKENKKLSTMMDEIVESVEAGEVTQAAIDNAETAKSAGVTSWGSEDGVVVGTKIDGTRINMNGNVLDES